MPQRYHVLANEFLALPDKLYYFGPVVGGPDAIYAFPTRMKSAEQIGMAAAGGAVGALLGAAAGSGNAHALQKLEADVPRAVTDDPDWPIDRDLRRAIVFPKAKLKSMRYGWLRGLNFEMGVRRFFIHAGMLRRSANLKFLRDAGWPL